MAANWSVEPDQDDTSRRVVVSGELDLADEERFVSEVDALVRSGGSTVLLDLEAVEFIDSSGVRALLRLRRDHGAHVRLVAASAAVGRVLRIAGVEAVLDGELDGELDAEVVNDSEAVTDS